MKSKALPTKMVRFTYGTCKDATLKIPAAPANLVQVAELVRESFFDYMFSKGALISDEVLVSSIGASNFFAGALGGWKTRLPAKDFDLLSGLVQDPMNLAVHAAQYRDPTATLAQSYLRASQNEALNDNERTILKQMIKILPKAA